MKHTIKMQLGNILAEAEITYEINAPEDTTVDFHRNIHEYMRQFPRWGTTIEGSIAEVVDDPARLIAEKTEE